MSYLDTVKDFFYLLLGILVSKYFWDYAERYSKQGLRLVNPLLFFIMVIWGASGFFFLSPILNFLPNLFEPILQLFYNAIPDWDIPLYIWAKSWLPGIEWELLKHRSWLFSSNIIPILLMVISTLTPRLYPSVLAKMRRHLNNLFNIAIGLSVGFFAHLCGDMILSFIPRGDIGVTIYSWNQLISLIWFALNMFLGISIPFFLIGLTSVRHKKQL
jgi:hypothetical protein